MELLRLQPEGVYHPIAPAALGPGDMNSEKSETFGALLRRYRMHAGLTQEALAERAGLSPNAISALERGERRRPYPHTLLALANALRLEPEQYRRLVRLREQEAVPSDGVPSDRAQPNGLQGQSRSRSEHPRQGSVPLAQSSLIGREAEYGEIARSLSTPECRLLTLVGPGGVGKTRLALQLASDLVADYRDGVIWVSLVPIAEPEQVAFTLVEALNLQMRSTEPVVDQLMRAVQTREMLLVLDNMEHVLEAVGLIEAILASAPGVICLVTSRERLGTRSEWVIDLHGLALSEDKSEEEGAHSAAVQLFAARARQAAHEFAVTAANRADVRRICRLVDGLPLGIELAAAWVRTLSAAEIADEIANNLEFLTSKDRGGPARHRSLQAAFEHSWNLLSADERQVLARLAVFRGGCDRAAAKAVAGGGLPLLAALVDKSVLRRAPDTSGLTRFDMHELLRQYALAKLQTNPDEKRRTRERHCAYFASQLGERTGAFLSGGVHAAWGELALDLDNIRAAWAWAVQQHDHQALTQMGPNLYLICEFQGFVEEGLTWFRGAAQALRAAVSETPHNPELVWALGQILSLYGKAASQGGHYRQAREQLTQGYGLLQQRGDILVETGTLVGLGYTAFVLGSYGEARAWFGESIGLSRAHGATYFLAVSESMLALVAQAEGAEDALTLAQVGLQDSRLLGQPHGLITALWVLSCILQGQGALAEAQEAGEEALKLSAELQHLWGRGSALLQLGAIALAQGDTSRAQDLVEESVRIFTQMGEPWSLGRALVARGQVAAAQGQQHEARSWFEKALNKAGAVQLDPIVCSARYGLATLLQEEAPAAALAFLEQVIQHKASEFAVRDRAMALRRVLIAADRRPPP